MGDKEQGFFSKAKDWLNETGEQIKSGISNTGGVGQEKTKESYHGTQYDANKRELKDPTNPTDERVRAGKDAAYHKKEEERANYNKEQYKENLNKDWNK